MLEVGRKVPKGKKVRPNTCKHNRLPSAVAPRIKNGLSLEYKEFIGTRSGQEYINNLWYKSSIRWRKMKTPTFLLLTMAVCMSSPILCLLLLFIPFSGIKSDIISPYVRFLFHLTSDVFFIILLMSTILDLHMIIDPGSVDLEGMSSAEKYYLFKSIPMTIPRRMITLWIIGITWRNISLVWRKGATRLLRNPWCIVDHLQICFYLAVIAGTYSANRLAIKEARIIATCEARLTKQESYFYESSSTTTQSISELFDFTLPTDFDGIFVAAPPVVGEGFGGPLFQSPSQGSDAIYHGGAHHMLLHYKNMTRFDWKATDPVFITEICFAVANILTFIRMINFCVILRFLGPLKISLEGMLVQNIKFLIIFSFVWISFAMGFSQLYRGFELLDQYQCKEDCSKLKAFQNIYYSMFTIFWGLFDLLDLSIFDIATKEMALQQIVGYLLYSAYSIIAVIIMLNALIAMMSNHYTRIEENAEVEWRFARADFMIDYMEYASDMPVPFNLISSLLDCVKATVKTIWRYTFGSFSKEQRRARQNTQSQECSCMEYYKKTISNIRIRFLQKRLILIEAEGRRAQQSTRLEEKLDSWRSDLSEIIRNTESIINKLQELPTTKRK